MKICCLLSDLAYEWNRACNDDDLTALTLGIKLF